MRKQHSTIDASRGLLSAWERHTPVLEADGLHTKLPPNHPGFLRNQPSLPARFSRTPRRASTVHDPVGTHLSFSPLSYGVERTDRSLRIRLPNGESRSCNFDRADSTVGGGGRRTFALVWDSCRRGFSLPLSPFSRWCVCRAFRQPRLDECGDIWGVGLDEGLVRLIAVWDTKVEGTDETFYLVLEVEVWDLLALLTSGLFGDLSIRRHTRGIGRLELRAVIDRASDLFLREERC